MVASPDVFSGGWKFDDLTWEQQDKTRRRWDWFDSGTQLTNDESGRITLVHESLLGVEPDEPEATGIQTGWVKWTASRKRALYLVLEPFPVPSQSV